MCHLTIINFEIEDKSNYTESSYLFSVADVVLILIFKNQQVDAKVKESLYIALF